MQRMKIFVGAIIMAATGGCSTGEELDAAGRQVERFHEQFNAGRFAAMYDEGAPALRSSGTAPEFARVMEGLRKKLGPVQSAERQGFNVNFGTQGTQVTLTFQTRFEAGSGIENFVYSGAGADKRLVSYRVNSDLLVTR